MRKRLCIRLDERGSVLVITLLILFAISIMGASLAMVSSMDLKISGNQRKTTQSLFVAEAGLSEAVHRLALPDPTVVSVNGWTGNAAISDSEPYDPDWTAMIYLTSPGSAPGGGGSIVSTGTLQDLSRPHLQYSAENGFDGVLTIQHKWVDRDGDGDRDSDEVVRYDKLSVPPENFTTGYPVEVVTVTGHSAQGVSTIQAEVTKKTITVRTLGALYVDHDVTLTGSCAFCGYNHGYDTPVGSQPGGAGKGKMGTACEDFHLPSGSLPGVTSTGHKVQTMGSSDIRGFPAPVHSSASNPFYDLNEVLCLPLKEVKQMLDKADNKSIVDPLNGVTYIVGDAKISSNLTGEGMIYVTGDLHASGNFVYKGLIYVEGDVHFSGAPWILGSMIVRGTTDFSFSAGNATVLYSAEALSRALNSSMPAIVLSWREM
jgi:hypothetical protein